MPTAVNYHGYAGDEDNTLGIAEAWAPGDSTDPNRFVAPAYWLMGEDDGLQPNHAVIQRDVFAGSPDSDIGTRLGKAKFGGPLKSGLYPVNGFELLVGSVGNVTALSAGPTVTSTAEVILGNSEVGGTTTYTVPDSTGFVVGRPCLIGTAISGVQEPSPLLDMTATTLVFGLMQHAHGAATHIEMPAVDLVAPYTRASGFANALRKYSIEEAVGGKYANRWLGCLVGDWKLTASASKFDVTATLHACGGKTRSSTFDELDETVGGWGELGFEFTDGALYFPHDAADTGTPVLAMCVDGQDWDLEINNNIVELANYDNSFKYRYRRGKRMVSGSYKLLNQASYPVAYEKFLLTQINVPWFSQCALNAGTDTAPKWRGLTFHAPNARYVEATELKTGNETIGEQVKVDFKKAGGLQKLYIYRLNQV